MKRCMLVIPLLLLGAAVAQRDARAGTSADVELGPVMPRTDRGAAPDRAEFAGGNPLWAVPLGALRFTRERPLFSASRRPPAPPAVAVAEPPPPARDPPPPAASRPSLVLLGTIIGGASRIGIFLDEATNKATRLMVGEAHDGWVLRTVTAAEAHFDIADRSATLVLRPTVLLATQGSPVAASDEPMPAVRHRRR